MYTTLMGLPKANKKLRVPYALAVYGKAEVRAVEKTLRQPTGLSVGKLTRVFEKKVARLFEKKYGVMVNSGSSANLIAIELLKLPAGSEVITPLLTFSTTVAPIVQRKLVPVFVDVDPDTYVVRTEQIAKMITKKTRALLIPNLIGNIPDMARLQALARKYKLVFIEDSCDTLGATIGSKSAGEYSDVSTTSFYATHIITAAGEGGMVCTNDEEQARKIRILSGWGRQSSLNETEDIDERLKGRLDDLPYDSKFVVHDFFV